MRRLQHFFNKILVLAGLKQPDAPKTITEILDKASLEQVLAEARFLNGQFQVEVHSLAEGEEAGAPRPAADIPPGYDESLKA